MEEENFNWLDSWMVASEGKDIKNSKEFKLLNSNNIDTHELTKHEKDKDAGEIQLNYKDEKEKEMDGRSFAKGLLAFVADMPEETLKALMMAALNGTDVAANVVGVAFNAMTNVDPAMQAAFNNGDGKKFKTLLNKNIQDFSKYLDNQKQQVQAIGEGSELNSKAAEMVSWIVQDTPYAIPINKKLKSFGIPTYIALPVAYGMAQSIAFSDDATLFLNSEQVQEFKKMIKVLPNTSEEKLYNTTFRMLEGTGLSFLFPAVFKGLKFAKSTVPKYMADQQLQVALGGGAITGSLVHGEVTKAEGEENVKAIIQKMKEASDHPNEFPSTDSDFSALSELSSDPENFPSTDYDFEVILGQTDNKIPALEIIDEDKEVGDQSSNKTMMEEFYALDKTQLQKISEATGHPVDQLQSAGATKLLSDPKTWKTVTDPKTWETVKKIITGISRQKKTIPTTLEQQQLAIPFIKTFDDDVKVLTYKVDDSVGKFSDDLERNLDIEALVKNDFDKKKIINTAVQQAKKYDQDSVFVSEQVLGRTKGSNAAFSFRFSTSKKFGDVIDISKELEKITGLQGYTFKTKALNLDTLPIANPKFIPNKRLYHNAIKRNGTTSNFRVAAFIGPDGRMIDGGLGSQVARIVEHRDVVKLAYDSRKVTDFEYIHGADFSQMYRFMEETGSIRISANGPRVSVEIYQKPTLSQLKTLVKKYNDDESFLGITIEAVMPKGESVKTFTRVEPEYMLELQGKINLSQLEKFLDFQAIRAKRFISIQSMNIKEYSGMSNVDYVNKLKVLESKMSSEFGTDISKPNYEYYINSVINKKDYVKYK